MDNSVEKLMTNNANGIHREIRVKRQKLGNVRNFKYLGTFVSDKGKTNRRLHKPL